jgi:hypothetical protein
VPVGFLFSISHLGGSTSETRTIVSTRFWGCLPVRLSVHVYVRVSCHEELDFFLRLLYISLYQQSVAQKIKRVFKKTLLTHSRIYK